MVDNLNAEESRDCCFARINIGLTRTVNNMSRLGGCCSTRSQSPEDGGSKKKSGVLGGGVTRPLREPRRLGLEPLRSSRAFTVLL